MYQLNKLNFLLTRIKGSYLPVFVKNFAISLLVCKKLSFEGVCNSRFLLLTQKVCFKLNFFMHTRELFSHFNSSSSLLKRKVCFKIVFIN